MRYLRRTRLVIGILAALGMVIAVAGRWADVAAHFRESGGVFTAAVALAALGVGCGALSWASLFEGRRSAGFIRAFVISLPLRYLPLGGIAQLAGQVGLSSGSASGHKRTGIFAATHAVVQTAAAVSFGAAMFLGSAQANSLLWAALAGVGVFVPALLQQRVLFPVTDTIGRLLSFSSAEREIPRTGLVWRSFCFALGAQAFTGLGFSLLLHASFAPTMAAGDLSAFSLAWAAGYVALPFPSGLAVREFVLTAMVPRDAALVVASSLALRLALLVAEVVLLLVALPTARDRRRVEEVPRT